MLDFDCGLPINVVFLDFDGVLNSEKLLDERDFKHQSHPPMGNCTCYVFALLLDAKCVQRLNRLVEVTDSFIVVSSSWRKVIDLDEIKRLLAAHGFIYTEKIIDITPDPINEPGWINSGEPHDRMCRGREIELWMQRSKLIVKQFLILDDSNDMVHLSHRLILTDPLAGLTRLDVDRGIEMMRDER